MNCNKISFGISGKEIINLMVYHIRMLFTLFEGKIQTGIRIQTAKEEERKAVQSASSVENILDCYGNAILRLAYSYLHNMSDAEDILQDTLIRYMQSAPDFMNPGHEKAWLLRVAANLSKNNISYNKIRETDELEETLIAQEREDLSFVWEAVRSLPEKYREVIHLYYQEGYKTAEISKILNRKESTIRTDLKRGRERLKEILKEVYDFE